MLQNVKYDLFLILTKGESYEGRINIEFDLKDKNINDLFIDFQGVGIREFIVNGSKISRASLQFSKHKIIIPRYNLLQNSLNKISIKFTNTFVNNSTGFHRFEDQYDGEVYLYTHLEPFNCNRWFPCFDQPSIRAPLTLKVVTPDHKWQMISNDNIQQSIQINSQIAQSILSQYSMQDVVERLEIPTNGNLIIFDQTPPISSYLYALAAGPYSSFSNESDYKIPMKIYCRKSKVKNAEPKERFRTIEIAIEFFEEFFQCTFPFKKYDMVFVPEFRINGMENVGIVIMRDTFMLPKDEKTFFEQQQWYKVAVHELSHMWFGDLVTIQWWNDLWLKESFAEFCTMICLTECNEFKYVKSPNQIGLHFLFEAITEDSKQSTHPIQVIVNHTNDAVTSYDRICYRKGAFFLKQLDLYLSRPVLLDALKLFFRDHRYGVVQLSDFMKCVETALKKKGNGGEEELQEYISKWLTKAGVNQIIPTIEERSNLSYSINLYQSYPVYGDNIIHEQIIDIATYDKDCNQKIYENLKLQPQLINKDIVSGIEIKPSAILINANVKGYLRVTFDQESQEFFLKNLSMIDDPLNRTYIWRILADNIKCGQITHQQYIQCIFDHFIMEQEEYTMPSILQTIQWILKYKIDNLKEKLVCYQQLQKIYLQKLETCQTKSMGILILSEALSLMTEDQVPQALQWFNESKIHTGDKTIILHQSERFQLLKHIFSSIKYDLDFKYKLLQQEKSRSSGDLDLLDELGCLASLPDDENKLKMWERYTTGRDLNTKKLEASAKHFYNPFNREQSELAADHFFESIESVFTMHHSDYAIQYFTHLSPTFLKRIDDLQKFKEIYERQAKTDKASFIKLLRNEIELFESILN